MPPASTALLSLVLCCVGRERVALPVAAVQEVVPQPALVRVPETAAWVLGLMRLREQAIPVVDLQARLELGSPRLPARYHVVIAPLAHTLLGLLVDRVEGVVEMPATAIERVPAFLAQHVAAPYVAGIVTVRGSSCLLLHLEALFPRAESLRA